MAQLSSVSGTTAACRLLVMNAAAHRIQISLLGHAAGWRADRVALFPNRLRKRREISFLTGELGLQKGSSPKTETAL